VPAPSPIPEYTAKWYLRADVGAGFGFGTGLSERGLQYGQNDVAFGDPSLFSSFFTDEGHSVGYSYGFGAGYYVNNNFRLDLTFELRQDKEPTLYGDFSEEAVLIGKVQDRTRLRSGVFLANAYYDIGGFGRLRPYFGGGLGFAVNEIERTHTTAYSTCDFADCASPERAVESGYTYSLAAQFTAGVSYQVWDGTHLDVNYRYLFVGGTDSSLTIAGDRSTVDIDDQSEHYVRAGLRWDLN
jgi:opacity protein-like surface antigen